MKQAPPWRAALGIGVLGVSLVGASATWTKASAVPNPEIVASGAVLFAKNCAFCHGRDARGGETGPDLADSELVLADNDGDKISGVVREGRFGTPMPAFNFTASELKGLAAFIHAQESTKTPVRGDRARVMVADLQTGDKLAGEEYFTGAGTCAKCHSATGDLAGIARRYRGLQLELRMLYPRHVKSRVTVTPGSGAIKTGVLEYLDEFTLGMRDAEGTYHSWRVADVKYAIDAPVSAHVELLGKYSDADVHNLMAYLQSLQ